MAVLYPIRKACPTCGKPMAAVTDDLAEGRLRYVCTVCEQDPLHNPTAQPAEASGEVTVCGGRETGPGVPRSPGSASPRYRGRSARCRSILDQSLGSL